MCNGASKLWWIIKRQVLLMNYVCSSLYRVTALLDIKCTIEQKSAAINELVRSMMDLKTKMSEKLAQVDASNELCSTHNEQMCRSQTIPREG